MTILVVYNGPPPDFPASDQRPDAARVQIGSLWVDYTGPVPVQEDVDAFFAPDISEQARRAGLAADANFQSLLTQAKTATNTQIDTWLTNNVTTLAQARTILGALIKIVATRAL